MQTGGRHDNQSLARLLLRHRDGLFAFIFSLVRNPVDAEDLFQQVSLVILQKEKDGILVEKFPAWSREIARRTILDYWKSNRREVLCLSEESIAAVEAAFSRHEKESDNGSASLMERLRRCLEDLPGHLRSLISLRYDEGLSMSDIARRLGRSAGAVQVALSRTRSRLLDCTERMEPEGTA